MITFFIDGQEQIHSILSIERRVHKMQGRLDWNIVRRHDISLIRSWDVMQHSFFLKKLEFLVAIIMNHSQHKEQHMTTLQRGLASA